VVDQLDASDFMGKPFNIFEPEDLRDRFLEMHTPLGFQNLYEEWIHRSKEIKELDTPIGKFRYGTASALGDAALKSGLPETFGMSVQTYSANDFLQKGPDDAAIKLLTDKRVGSVRPNE